MADNAGPSPAERAKESTGGSPPTDRIRDTAKWLIGVFGAIGVLVVAKVELTDLRGFPFGQRVGALMFVVAALAGICLATSGVANLLLPRQITMPDLATAGRRDAARKFFDQNPEAIRAFPSLNALLAAWRQDLAAYKSAFRAYRVSPTPHHQARLRLAAERLTPVEEAVRSATLVATYHRLRADYHRMVRWRLFPGIGLCAIGIIGFSLTTGKSETPAPNLANVNLPGVTLDHVSFHGASLREANLANASFRYADLTDADLSGADLSNADLTGANLAGAKTEGVDLDSVIWQDTTCPDGTLSSDVGGTCIAHLVPASP